MSKTPAPLVYTPFKGTLYQFGVGFAYYSQQAVQSQNEVIGQFPRLILLSAFFWESWRQHTFPQHYEEFLELDLWKGNPITGVNT